LIDRFNKTVAYVVADGNTYIMDATQKYCPFGLIPYSILNTYALLISRKNDKLLQIGNNNTAYDDNVIIKMKLDENGNISGTAELNSINYAKEYYAEKIKRDEKKFIEKYIEEPYQGLKLDSFSYDNIDSDTGNLIQHIKFNNQVNESGGFLLMNYNLFTGLSKNLFTTDERFTNVNFGYPYRVSVEETIELPAGSKTDDLPKNIILQTPDKEIIISRKITRTGNILQVKLEFLQLVTLVQADLYPGLKEFYRKMTDMLNQDIVIKVGK
jgi:hypothetical protein